MDSNSATWRRACTGCTRAKRQCTKQTPACRRCTDRGLTCAYPPARQPPAAASLADVTSSDSDAIPNSSESETFSLAEDIDFDFPMLAPPPPLPQQPKPSTWTLQLSPPQAPGFREHWFLSWESLEVGHVPALDQPLWFDEGSLQKYVSVVEDWLRLWVTEGHSPLVHRQLYRAKMPRCVQDAYTVLTAYLHRTAQTEAAVFQIVRDRVTQLIQDHGLDASVDGVALSLADHLARVQSLLVYQTICLFNGNIRLRAQAEALVPTLFLWAEQMWKMVATTARGGGALITDEAEGDGTTVPWRTWILAETVRRAWLTVHILQNVFLTMQRGFSECPGGVTCTVRTGLWTAASAYEWETTMVRQKDPLFVPSMEMGKLFLEAAPLDVDEFGQAILSISFGLDKMERWLGNSDKLQITSPPPLGHDSSVVV